MSGQAGEPKQWRIVWSMTNGSHGVSFIMAPNELSARFKFSTQQPNAKLEAIREEEQPQHFYLKK